MQTPSVHKVDPCCDRSDSSRMGLYIFGIRILLCGDSNCAMFDVDNIRPIADSLVKRFSRKRMSNITSKVTGPFPGHRHGVVSSVGQLYPKHDAVLEAIVLYKSAVQDTTLTSVDRQHSVSPLIVALSDIDVYP